MSNKSFVFFNYSGFSLKWAMITCISAIMPKIISSPKINVSTLFHLKTDRECCRCIILCSMYHTMIQKKFLSPRLGKNSPKQETLKSFPQFQKITKIY